MLTIVIFTNSRYHYLFPLLKDIKSSNTSIKIWIVDYGKSPDKNIYKSIKKKNIKVFFDKKSIKYIDNSRDFTNRYYKYIQIIKTKYLWFIGDDDRIDKKYFQKLIKFLRYRDNSGFTLSYISFRQENLLKKIQYSKNGIREKNINLANDINDFGMISTQIINTNCFRNIKNNLDKKILLNHGYPQIYIILEIIKKFKDWKKISNIIVYYRVGGIVKIKKEILKRLNQEFRGYLLPLKQKYYLDIYKKLFKRIFIKNILSWILFSIEICGKRSTYKILKNNNKLSPFILSILIIKILVFVTPYILINYMKKVKRIFNF
jgi:hypothetical protein